MLPKMKAISCTDGWRLPLRATVRHGTLYVDGARWFAHASAPPEAEGGDPVTCIQPLIPKYDPSLPLSIPTPRVRRLVTLDAPCSDTSDDDEQISEQACRVARANVERTIVAREREEVLRRVQLRIAEPPSESTLQREQSLVGDIARQTEGLCTLQEPANCNAMQAIAQFAKRTRGPMRSTRFRMRGFATRDLHAACFEVVRVLPGWYIHRDFCTSLPEAVTLLRDIARRYNVASWRSTMRRCVVRPMFHSTGVLQNIPAWMHARAACVFMIWRARGSRAAQRAAHALHVPTRMLTEIGIIAKQAS